MSTEAPAGGMRRSGKALDYDAFFEGVDASLLARGTRICAVLLIDVAEV